MRPVQTGVALGVVFALAHALAIVVLRGALDVWMMLHFIRMEYAVLPMDVVTLLIGIGLAFVVGFVFGSLFAVIYNWVPKVPRRTR